MRVLQHVCEQLDHEHAVARKERARDRNRLDRCAGGDATANRRQRLCEAERIALACALLEQTCKEIRDAETARRIEPRATAQACIEVNQRYVVPLYQEQHDPVLELDTLERRSLHALEGERRLREQRAEEHNEGRSDGQMDTHHPSSATSLCDEGPSTPTVRFVRRSSSRARV